MFTLSVETKFSGAHQLAGYDGKCSRLHGHSWRVSAAVQTEKLNSIGISIDFEILKTILKEVVDEFDHRHLNELEQFASANPTAENIASYIFRKYDEKLAGKAGLVSVTVWESEIQSVTYTP